jgi:3'(2'), 5'-bisphosphate nucleotidase
VSAAPPAPPTDHVLAVELARRAGELLLEIRRPLADGDAPDVGAIRDDGDRRANDLLLEALENARPSDSVLSEESKDDPSRLDASRVWIIDPLDGTREFGEPPRTDWAVHVALVMGGRPVAGAVALPALDQVLASSPPETVSLPNAGRPRVVVSRTRPPAAATFLADELDAQLVEMGSAGAKAMSVIRGESDVYVHSGGQYEWDSCAPVAVAQAAGLHCSRIDGAPLVYNNPDPYLPDLLICRPELADDVLTALRRFDAS